MAAGPFDPRSQTLFGNASSPNSVWQPFARNGVSKRSAVLIWVTTALALHAQQVPDTVMKAEAERVAVVEKVKPSVVAVFGPGGQGGGSGVLISDDGFALTNFHVVAGAGAVMQCGLADGVLYDAVLVGIDKVGDVALIKLFPKPGQKNEKFPFATLGNSDLCREGDWSLAMGNPFLLATDFTPTVTFGLISGVHRYQYPSGTLLEYTDCIQIDTSINPGNSGGPLFNMKGELIGINGRGSFDKRARINSGVGYAISINQIKNFLGHLHAGLDVDHASLGAAVTTQTDKTGIGKMEVTQMLESSDVYRRGLAYGDELVSFDGRPIFSVNHFKNVMGLFPRGWRVPMEYRRTSDKGGDDETGARKEILVRLMGIQRKVLEDPDPKEPGPKGGAIKPPAPNKSPAAKYYIAKEGFANYYFNKEASAALLKNFSQRGDFSKFTGPWIIEGSIKFFKANAASALRIEIADEKAREGVGITPVVRMKVGDEPLPHELFPQKPGQMTKDYKTPEGSGGLLAALYLYRNFLMKGDKAFETEWIDVGMEPFYPPSADRKKSFKDRKMMAEVMSGKSGPYTAKFFFNKEDAKEAGKLEYFEVRLYESEDPCEVYCSNYKQLPGGQWLPHRLTVIHGDTVYGELDFSSIKMSEGE
jgi:serine protease Do